MQYPTILETVFRKFSEGAEEMTLNQYMKFSKECGFMDRKFTKSDVTTIFGQSSSQENKTLNFGRFKDNLDHFANKKHLDKNDIVKKIEAYGKGMYFKSACMIEEAYSLNSLSSGSRASLPTMSDVSIKSVNDF